MRNCTYAMLLRGDSHMLIAPLPTPSEMSLRVDLPLLKRRAPTPRCSATRVPSPDSSQPASIGRRSSGEGAGTAAASAASKASEGSERSMGPPGSGSVRAVDGAHLTEAPPAPALPESRPAWYFSTHGGSPGRSGRAGGLPPHQVRAGDPRRHRLGARDADLPPARPACLDLLRHPAGDAGPGLVLARRPPLPGAAGAGPLHQPRPGPPLAGPRRRRALRLLPGSLPGGVLPRPALPAPPALLPRS